MQTDMKLTDLELLQIENANLKATLLLVQRNQLLLEMLRSRGLDPADYRVDAENKTIVQINPHKTGEDPQNNTLPSR